MNKNHPLSAWSEMMTKQMAKAVHGACEDAMIHGTGAVFFTIAPHGFDVNHVPFEYLKRPTLNNPTEKQG